MIICYYIIKKWYLYLYMNMKDGVCDEKWYTNYYRKNVS